MQFDALTLSAVTDELSATILGGRIQRVVLTSPLSIGLEVYAHRQRWQVLASAHPVHARVHLVRGKLTRGVEQVTPLLLLLRKYILGGRITAIEQPPLERILLLSIAKERESRNKNRTAIENPDADSIELNEEDEGETLLPSEAEEIDLMHTELIIETMERRSNIMLVDDNNVVLESVKRVTPKMSQRVVMPRSIYELPPAQTGKRDPHTASAAGFEALQNGKEKNLAKAVVAAYKAVSPQMAREVVARAGLPIDTALNPELPWYLLAARLRDLWNSEPEPSLVEHDGEPIAYAAYLIEQHPNAQPFESMSAALERFYSAQEGFTSHRQRRGALGEQLQQTRSRFARQHEQLQAEFDRAQELEQLRWEGEMIFAYLHELKPRQASFEVEGKTIQLDPLRSHVEVAQQRFRAYEKAKNAIAGLPERLAAAQSQLNGIDEMLALLEIADSYEQIEQIAQDGLEAGYLHEEKSTGGKRKPKSAKVRPLHLVSSDGLDIFVGRSTSQNSEVTFKIARNDDWWLHVRNIPGGHVIVRGDGREIPETTFQEAAGLAAYFSPFREEASVEVEIARRNTVRRIPNGPPSLVNYRAERTLRVKPLPPW